MNVESALTFLEQLSKEVGIKNSIDGKELLKKVDPEGNGLDLEKFLKFFFLSNEESLKEGELMLSKSMNSQGIKKKKVYFCCYKFFFSVIK